MANLEERKFIDWWMNHAIRNRTIITNGLSN